MKKMTYKIVHALFYAVSLLPYGVLYVLSDIFYVFVRLSGYRRRVVRRNIETSFPEKSTSEHRAIERRFYHWLCDYAVETIKLLTVSDHEFVRHLEFRGTEAVEQCLDNGQPCAWLLGPYCNWEYLSATALGMKRWGVEPEEGGESSRRESRAVMGLIYKPLRNDAMDRLFLTIRQKKYGTCVSRKDILRKLVQLKQEGRMSLFGYIADQGPRWENIHLWLPFLNHDTPVFTGSERIIRKPQYYLWTHNRWKRTRQT